MPVTMVGLVYYADDPNKNIFRKVYPVDDDSELDNPEWTTARVDPNRRAVLVRVPRNSPRANAPMTGTP